MTDEYVPQAGDVGTLETGTFSGFFIELGTRSRADHVIIADGQGGCYEATPSGVRHCSLAEYAGHRIAWDKRRIKTPEQRAIAIATCERFLGTRYMWRAIAIIALGDVFHVKIPKWFMRNMDPERGLICSEYGTIVLRAMGFDVLAGKEVWDVAPADLEDLVLYL